MSLTSISEFMVADQEVSKFKKISNNSRTIIRSETIQKFQQLLFPLIFILLQYLLDRFIVVSLIN